MQDPELVDSPIYILAKIVECTIALALALAAEAEVAGLFMNAQEVISIWHTLIEMGHPQPLTPLRTDTTTA